MKIGMFTDSHYCTKVVTCRTRMNSLSLGKLKAAAAAFSGCDLIVCLGDFIDSDDTHMQDIHNLKTAAAVLNSTGIPVACIMGNHDAFLFTAEEFAELTGFMVAPYHIEADGKHLIFLDASYTRNGKPYMPGDVDWTDTDIPYHDKIEKWLSESELPAFIFVHQNLDPFLDARYIIHSAEEIRSIFQASGKIRAVYQGHYHNGNTNNIGGTDYITLKAMCEGIEINADTFKIIEI